MPCLAFFPFLLLYLSCTMYNRKHIRQFSNAFALITAHLRTEFEQCWSELFYLGRFRALCSTSTIVYFRFTYRLTTERSSNRQAATIFYWPQNFFYQEDDRKRGPKVAFLSFFFISLSSWFWTSNCGSQSRPTAVWGRFDDWTRPIWDDVCLLEVVVRTRLLVKIAWKHHLPFLRPFR